MRLGISRRPGDMVVAQRNEKSGFEDTTPNNNEVNDPDASTKADNDGEEPVTPEFQYGVQKAQASNQVWTVKQLLLAYLL